ncbi:hypothetical protein [Streptomyces alboflavus]|uniref:hypothetical protein n=1 Tax=Streptomyces alboflavus TaxID=67267 RepID=UPI00133177AE|nr:hypothetical protein [Streptomyces alboflavus]
MDHTTSTRGPAGTRIVAAGIDWDAVKVTRSFALQALERLVSPGAVAVDPHPAEPVLYFLVPPGSTAGWSVIHSEALSETTHITLPHDGKLLPPGPYWLRPPGRGSLLTDVDALRAALETVVGPRPDAPDGAGFPR